MAPISLPCVAGAEVCSFKTLELEYEHAIDLLKIHVKITHGGGNEGSHVERNKPEKFPRPSLEADSTSEAWEDFIATWAQY